MNESTRVKTIQAFCNDKQDGDVRFFFTEMIKMVIVKLSFVIAFLCNPKYLQLTRPSKWNSSFCALSTTGGNWT